MNCGENTDPTFDPPLRWHTFGAAHRVRHTRSNKKTERHTRTNKQTHEWIKCSMLLARLIAVRCDAFAWHCAAGWSRGCVHWPQVNKHNVLFIGDGRSWLPRATLSGHWEEHVSGRAGLESQAGSDDEDFRGKKAGLVQTKDKVMYRIWSILSWPWILMMIRSFSGSTATVARSRSLDSPCLIKEACASFVDRLVSTEVRRSSFHIHGGRKKNDMTAAEQWQRSAAYRCTQGGRTQASFALRGKPRREGKQEIVKREMTVPG